MTVFKTVWKIINKNKKLIILYTIILIVFGASDFATQDESTNFVATKPNILIINNDEDNAITNDLIEYLTSKNNIKTIANNEEAIADSLFYRDVNCIFYIPKNFSKDLISGINPFIEIKQTNDYSAMLAINNLNKYLKLLNIYQHTTTDEQELINRVNSALTNETNIEINSKLDAYNLSKATHYYNFLNYSILASCVYVICLVLSTFKQTNVNKRNIISSTNYKKINLDLLLSTSIVTFIMWTFYVLLSLILIGKTMFSLHGMLYIINSFFFTLCSLTIALLIGNLFNNKNAINSIINVIALGSSFLCGSFVPQELLPSKVINIAHFLPSYWFISSNELIKTIEEINYESLKPLLQNISIILIYTIVFVVLTNIITKHKRKLD